jgi:hypothetical protein
MHSPCNTFLNFHETIHSLSLHLHAHIALEEEPLEAQDLGLELCLQKNPTKKFNKFNISMMGIAPHHLF